MSEKWIDSFWLRNNSTLGLSVPSVPSVPSVRNVLACQVCRVCLVCILQGIRSTRQLQVVGIAPRCRCVVMVMACNEGCRGSCCPFWCWCHQHPHQTSSGYTNDSTRVDMPPFSLRWWRRTLHPSESRQVAAQPQGGR